MKTFSDIIGFLDENTNDPLYKQLQKKLKHAIENKYLKPDASLPAERDIAHIFNISRITVRKAIEGLVNEGFLTRRQGAGTFVANRMEKNFSQLTSFSEEMISKGMKPSSQWLAKTISEISTEEVMKYGLSPRTKIYRFNRRRFADNIPISLEYAIIPVFCLPSIDVVKSSLYKALNNYGFRPFRALQRLRAIPLNEKQAKLLDAQTNDPGLLVERRGFLADGRIVEISHSYYKGDTYDIVAELY